MTQPPEGWVLLHCEIVLKADVPCRSAIPVLPMFEPTKDSARRRGDLMTDVPPEAQPNDLFDYEHNPT